MCAYSNVQMGINVFVCMDVLFNVSVCVCVFVCVGMLEHSFAWQI